MFQAMPIIFVASLMTALGATFAVRELMLRYRILDQPTERSSHTQPTPSLGGLGIIFGFWIGLVVAALAFAFPVKSIIGLLAGTTILLVITLDDLVRPMGVLSKLAVQVGAASILVGFGVRLDQVQIPLVGTLTLGALGALITVFWLVWISNIYNFMDGIDGITSLETLVVSLFLILLSFLIHQPAPPLLATALLGGVAGFLTFNFPPASIFMGDVGSAFLGFTLAALAVMGNKVGIPFVASAMLLGTFLFDSTYTILWRLRRKENIFRAHRSHLYQRLVKQGLSHGQVDAIAMGITVLFGLCSYFYVRGNPLLSGLIFVGILGILSWGTIWVEKRAGRVSEGP